MLCGWGVKEAWCNLQVKLCDPCLSALEVVTTMRYINRRILYVETVDVCPLFPAFMMVVAWRSGSVVGLDQRS